MDRDESFGRLLRRLRKAHDLTQEALAQQVFCALDTIKKIEAGLRRPSRQLAAQFADCLGLANDERAAFLMAARTLAPGAAKPASVEIGPVASATSNLRLHPGSLPAQSTPLIGREHEIASVCVLLQRPDVRLVTLTGPGGTGKTRLALQVASELGDTFRDGVWLVNLVPLSDPELVATTIAQALDVRETNRPLRERLQDYLRDKQALLLLDNFEQVVEAAPLVAALLAAAPGLKMLVTSREPLHLAAEHEFPVSPLALPDPRQGTHVRVIASTPAVALFVARAQATQPAFALTQANAAAVVEICRRLDGLPLAIELAAARVKLLSAQALLARLDQTLKLLTGGTRDAPARQQTIRATIDWSYYLLDEGEQTLFARLSVFVGDCTLEAAEAVCNVDGDLPLDVLDGLAALLDKSLLKQEERIAEEPRLTMLETIRAYALERLAASEEEDAVRWQHTIYYLSLAEAAEPELYGPQQMLWAERLESDQDNLRAAIDWCIKSGSKEQGWRLAAALRPFWEIRGYVIEGWAHLASALSLNGMDIPIGPRTATRAKALTCAAVLAMWNRHDLALASRLLTESLAIQRELGNQLGIAHALAGFGNLERLQLNFNQSALFYEESLALFRATADTHGCATSLMWLGQIARFQGQFERAVTILSESLALFQQIGDIHGKAWVLLVMGETAHFQRDYARATAIEEECLMLFQQMGAKIFAAMTEVNLGFMAYHQGNDAKATMYFVSAFSFGWEAGMSTYMAHGLIGLGTVAAALQPERAARLFGAAAKLLDSEDAELEPTDRGEYNGGIATARARLGEEAFAAAWAVGRALSLELAVAEALHISEEVQPVQNETEMPE